MTTSVIERRRLNDAADRLGDVALDPSRWPDFLSDICESVAATGAVLFQSDVRTPDVPRTPSLDEFLKVYFQSSLNAEDVRAARGVPKLLAGAAVVIDQDLVTPEEMRADPMYNELLAHNFQWFAVVGFWAGRALWGLSIQRTTADGPFEESDKQALALLSDRLTEVSTLSTAVGRIALSSATNAMDLVNQAAIAVDRFGFVLTANAAALTLFDDDLHIRSRRLFVADPRAKNALQILLDHMRTTPDTAPLRREPFAVRRREKAPVVVRVLPVHPAARSPFLGARALLTFSCAETKAALDSSLVKAFGLTPAEARLAALIAEGRSPGEAAEKLGVAYATVRNQLKAVFAKTDTRRQSELVALLARL
jgi:DNA-binding CsgD family transcriptional regulator